MKSKIAIPKGRLYDYARALFIAYNAKDIGEEGKKYLITDEFEDVDVFKAKVKAIPQLISSKTVEFGLCGYDVMLNSGYMNSDIFEICDTGLDKINICLCSKMTKQELFNLKRPVVVATEYENIANEYFTKLHIPHYVLNTCGSTEGYTDLNADCIIDVVETGETLKANGLEILDVLFVSTLRLYGHSQLIDSSYPDTIENIYKYYYKKIVEIDGNDGTGKSSRIKELQKLFPKYEFLDRGRLSPITLLIHQSSESRKFILNKDNQKLFIPLFENSNSFLIEASVETCQKRIQERGDSIEEPFHNSADLSTYAWYFNDLAYSFNIKKINSDGESLKENVEEISKLIK